MSISSSNAYTKLRDLTLGHLNVKSPSESVSAEDDEAFDDAFDAKRQSLAKEGISISATPEIWAIEHLKVLLAYELANQFGVPDRIKQELYSEQRTAMRNLRRAYFRNRLTDTVDVNYF